ncbi:MAG TPA: DUF177 domain-containing protein [Labilithrix sp.]|jgi:uncharacterized protein
MSTHELSISVTDLDAGGRSYRFPLRAAWIRSLLEGHEATASGKDGEIAVRASKSGPDVVVHGTLDAELTVPCARCTEPCELPIHAELSVLYVPASQLRQAGGDDDEKEIDAEEADTLAYDGETVVLDGLVRDEILLEVPMIPLCSEACPGMSAAPPPEEKGVDPRLLPLMRFKGKT